MDKFTILDTLGEKFIREEINLNTYEKLVKKVMEIELLDEYVMTGSAKNLAKQKYFLNNLKKINTKLQDSSNLSPDHVKRLKAAREKIKSILTKFQEDLIK